MLEHVKLILSAVATSKLVLMFFHGSHGLVSPEDLAAANAGTGASVLVAPNSRDDALLPCLGLDNEATCDLISE